MARSQGRRSRREKNADSRQVETVISQLPRCQLENLFSPIEPLSQEQVEKIHDASMRILEEQGIEVLGGQALDMFRKGGAIVESLNNSSAIVKMDRGLV